MKDDKFYKELLYIRDLLNDGSLYNIERHNEREFLDKIEHSELKKLTEYYITHYRLLREFISDKIT
tara:strand:+ start:2165 stop:2362 length:198 start_codon:yes stop_codon:yes gene_type:complete